MTIKKSQTQKPQPSSTPSEKTTEQQAYIDDLRAKVREAHKQARKIIAEEAEKKKATQ